MENPIPDCAEFSFAFKARQQAHGELSNCCRNAEDGRKNARSVFLHKPPWTEENHMDVMNKR